MLLMYVNRAMVLCGPVRFLTTCQGLDVTEARLPWGQDVRKQNPSAMVVQNVFTRHQLPLKIQMSQASHMVLVPGSRFPGVKLPI